MSASAPLVGAKRTSISAVDSGVHALALLWQFFAGTGFPNHFFCDSWVVGFLEGPTMVSRTSDWRDELGRWLKPFLDRLGHKARRQMCPLYVSGLIGPGDRKSVQPMAKRLALGACDQLHHFIAAGVWDATPVETELLVQADRLVGGSDAVLVIDDTAIAKKGTHSVGVAPQYASALGKIANCQTLVSLTWARGTPQSCWRCGCFFPRVGRASGLDWIERMGPAEYGMARTKPEIALVEIDRGGQAGASPSAARRHSIDSGRRHQHSAGAQKDGEDQAIGRSKGGLSTKIHLMVDALDNPLACFLTGGQAHDLLATQEKPGADRTGACTRLARSRLLSLTGNSAPPCSSDQAS